MLARIISGLVMATSIVLILLFLPPWGLAVALFLVTVVACDEYLGITHQAAPVTGAAKLIFTVATLLVVMWPVINDFWPAYTHGIAMTVGFMIMAIHRLSRPLPIETSIERLALRMFGVAYLGATFPYVYMVRQLPEGEWVLILVMAIAFGSDTGAYFAGRFLGRHKLYPVISPKKTIEGVVGGVLAGVLCAWGCTQILPGQGDLTVLDCVILGTGGSLLGVIGDLVESMLKRAYSVKDSGHWIPGHGGALDRLDGFVFILPFAYLYLGAVR